MEGKAHVVISISIVRLDEECFVERIYRFFQFALIYKYIAHVTVGVSKVGFE